MARSRTTFKRGQSGNPKGRPPGAKDVMPKVRDLVNAVLAGHEKEIAEAFRRAACNPKSVQNVLELAAKLNREVGPGAVQLVTEDDRPVEVTLRWPDSPGDQPVGGARR